MGVDPISGKVPSSRGQQQQPDRRVHGSRSVRPRVREGRRPGGGTGPERVCTTSCQAGETGGGVGELAGVLEAEVSPNGRIYVSESTTLGSRYSRCRAGSCTRSAMTSIQMSHPAPRSARTNAKPATADISGARLTNEWASSFGPDRDFYLANTDNSRVDRYRAHGTPPYGFGKDVNGGGGTGVEMRDGRVQGWRRDWRARSNSAPGGDRARSRPEDLGRRLERLARERVLASAGHHLCLRHRRRPGWRHRPRDRTANCQDGSSDDDVGEFSNVQGVAVDAAGTAYVGDTSNSRVNAYDSRSRFLFSFGTDVSPSGGGGSRNAGRAVRQATR